MDEGQQSQEGECIKSAGEIARLFNRVKTQLSPVTLRFPGFKEPLTSYVTEVDPKRKYILLDDVLPSTDSRVFKERKGFNLETFNDGCRLRVKDLKAKPTKDKDGNINYRIPFPDQIHYLQRRASFRAQVRRTLEIPARTMDINRNVISGLLRDLSADGCQVQIAGDVVELLKPHKNIVPLKLYFPNDTSLVLKTHLRFVGYNEDTGFTKVGCEFAELDGHKEREISRVVTDLQRDYINFTKHGGKEEGIPPLFLPPEDDDDIERMDNPKPAVKTPRVSARQTQSAHDQKAKETRRQKREEREPNVDVRLALKGGIAAVKSLIGSVRLEQPLPFDELEEAAQTLYTAWSQSRDHLMLLTHLRNTTDFVFEHPVSYAVLLADQASRNDSNLTPDDLRDLMFAGLCHDVPKALLPDSNHETGLMVSREKRSQLEKNILSLRSVLSSDERVPRVARTVVSQNFERLDGSGLPDGLQGSQLSDLGKLASAMDILDTASHIYRDDVYYHPAIAYKRALSMPEQVDSTLIKRAIMAQGLYPLGAPVKLSNGYLGLVMRQTEDRKPRIVRLAYNLAEDSQLPAKDIDLESSGVTVAGHADPIKYRLSNTLLQLPLQID